MFGVERRKSRLNSSLAILELIYHSTVRAIRRDHKNALVGLLTNILQTVIFIGAFIVTFNLLGMRGSSVRGDFTVYIMTGIFTYMCNIKTSGAVIGSEGPTSGMMLHAPMNTAIAIGSAALAALYTQILSIVAILAVYHVAYAPVQIEDPIGALGMIILSWLYGIGIGMVVLAIKPWWPAFAKVAQQVYTRVNMFASGKMFLGNTLSFSMLAMFDWNPLFHIIDQMRGFVFINYNPHNSSLTYPVYFTLALIAVGLMGEFKARKHASVSWNAAR